MHSEDPERPAELSIAVAICTFRRNEPLRRLLTRIQLNAAALAGRAVVGVVVVDDNPEGSALEVCEEFAQAFGLGLHYRCSGKGNISVARNLALEVALPLGEWVAMTDDDCEPVQDWLATFVEVQASTGADALTGPCVLRVSAQAPRWLREQPFLDDGQLRFSDGQELTVAATNNSFLRSRFFAERPELRFEPSLGVLGGEDMVFFRTAARRGLTIRYSARSVVYGIEPPSRQTLRHQLRSRFWLGNTEFVTNRFLGEAPRLRWMLRGGKLIGAAIARPLVRLASGRAPQWRYALAMTMRAAGMLAGALGLRLRHH